MKYNHAEGRRCWMTYNNAKVILKWSNGKTVELGTLAITADEKAESKVNIRIRWLRQRIGWELVRKGFWLMFPWRKWEERQE